MTDVVPIHSASKPFLRGDHAELADRLLEQLGKRSHVVGAEGDLWAFKGASWQRHDRDELRRIVKGFAGSKSKASRSGRLSVSSGAADGAATLAYAEAARASYFDETPPGASFANGFVDVEDGKPRLRPHHPNQRARHAHAFDFDPTATAEPMHEFIDEVFGDCSEEERAARSMFIQEHVGACLLGVATRFQKCVLCTGAGGNGKSTANEIFYRGALPDGTTVSLPPQFWIERFQISRLLGAYANVVDELPESELMKTGAFKSVVAGEPVHVERKHRDAFEARIRAGHVFAANVLPATRDLTDGFFRRFVVIKFGRRFDNTASCRVNRAAEIVAACRPGIATWAVDGGARLIRQGHYTIPPSAAEATAEWKGSCDSVSQFFTEQTRPLRDGETGTLARPLFAAYKDWAADNGFSRVSSRTFAQRAESLGKGSIRHSSGKRYPVELEGQP